MAITVTPMRARLSLVCTLLATVMSMTLAPARADEPGACEPGARAWIAVKFEGSGLSPEAARAIVRDLQVDLGWRAIELCLSAPAVARPPIATIAIATDDGRHVTLTVDAEAKAGEPEHVSRTSDFGAIPADGLELAVATTTDELLRLTWLELALRKAQAEQAAAEKAAIAIPALPAPPPVPRRALVVTTELGGAILAGFPSGTLSKVQPDAGAALRLGVADRSLGISAGALLAPAAILDFRAGRVQEWRLPLDLAARWLWEHGQLSGALEFGPTLAIVRLTGEGAVQVQSAHSLEWGGRIASTLVWGGPHARIWLAVSAEMVPQPSQVTLASPAAAGHSSWLWLASCLGISLRL